MGEGNPPEGPSTTFRKKIKRKKRSYPTTSLKRLPIQDGKGKILPQGTFKNYIFPHTSKRKREVGGAEESEQVTSHKEGKRPGQAN